MNNNDDMSVGQNAYNMHNFIDCLKAITMKPAQTSAQWLVTQRIQLLLVTKERRLNNNKCSILITVNYLFVRPCNSNIPYIQWNPDTTIPDITIKYAMSWQKLQ